MNKVKKLKEIENDATIGEKIKYLRTHKKIKQEKLADSLGITRYLLMKYEADKTPVPAELLTKLSEKLDTSINYLLGITESKSSNIENQDIVKRTGLSDKSIRILGELKIIAPNTIDTINYLIEQEEIFPISDFSYVLNENEDEEKIFEKALQNYYKAEECWDDMHLGILSKIANFYDINIDDKMIYIDEKNNIKSKEDFANDFQRWVHTREKVSIKDLVDTKTLKEIEYLLTKSKENKQKDNTEKIKQLEKYLEKCNSIKIVKEHKGEEN